MASAPAPAPAWLPPASISFDWPRERHQTGWMNFMAYKNSIVAVDHEGRTLLYDCAARAVRAMPQTTKSRPQTISFAVGDGLYVLGREPGCPPQWHYFQALVYGRPSDLRHPEDWDWRNLLQPKPRFDFPDNSEDPSKYAPEEVANAYAVSSYAVVGDSQFWISTVAGGTHLYNTANGMWSRFPGAAALPFRGRAEHVPENGLWFGFSPEDERLCAADLATRPVARKVWEDLHPPPPPESCSLS